MHPDFLVIGGMKCGSTTLYHDLASITGVTLAEKELNLLSTPSFTKQDVQQGYAAAFRKAGKGELLGDVSTTYSMLPNKPGVAELAKKSLPASTKIIYVVREPVSRAVSHHHHMSTWHSDGKINSSINVCISRHPEIIDFSRYATQLRPWRQAFGDEAICVVLFEEYTSDRIGVVSSLCNFLHVEPASVFQRDYKIYNKSSGKPVLNRFWVGVQESSLYQNRVRPRLPTAIKKAAFRWLLPKAPKRFAPPSPDTVEQIISELESEEKELRALMGRRSPLWNWKDVRTQYLASEMASVAYIMNAESPH